jgi:hypothetical protein
MRRHILGIAFAALVFFGSNRSTELYRRYYDPFRPVSRWKLEHFGKFHYSDYEAWDGRLLTLYCYTLDSEQEARDWFSELKSDAAEILEQSPFLGESGEQVGERAVAVLPPNRHRGRVAAVILVKGENVYMIFGESLSQVLEFEKFPDMRRHNLTAG